MTTPEKKDRTVLIVLAVLLVAALGMSIYTTIENKRLKLENQQVKLLEDKNRQLENENAQSKTFQENMLNAVQEIAARRDSIQTQLIYINKDHENKITYLLTASDSARVAFFSNRLSTLEQRKRDD